MKSPAVSIPRDALFVEGYSRACTWVSKGEVLMFSVTYPRYGYRRTTILLREDGWHMNFKRVYRLWCQDGDG